MPSAYTLESLPKPKNPDIHMMAIPARKTVVIRFSGFNTDTNIKAHRETPFEVYRRSSSFQRRYADNRFLQSTLDAAVSETERDHV